MKGIGSSLVCFLNSYHSRDITAIKRKLLAKVISVAAQWYYVTPTLSLRVIACVQCVGCPQSITRVMFAIVKTWHVRGKQPKGKSLLISAPSDCNLLYPIILHISWRTYPTNSVYHFSARCWERSHDVQLRYYYSKLLHVCGFNKPWSSHRVHSFVACW